MCRAREEPQAKSIEVYLSGGSCWSVNMNVNVFAQLMNDDFIKDNEFIPLELHDGTKGYVRKNTIQGFCEEPEM